MDLTLARLIMQRNVPPAAADRVVHGEAFVQLNEGEACAGSGLRADFFESTGGLNCDGGERPVFVYIITGAGTHLLDARNGESLGLLAPLELLLAETARLDIPTRYVISTAAVFGATMAQTGMERVIEGHLVKRLTDTPCARAVLIGHSHGGVTITSVLYAAEALFVDRVLGVLIDRTPALYDRPAKEIPARAALLNFFQTNEGWHGVPIEQPNVRNFDQSSAVAPIALSDGGGGPAIVTHKTLDDAPEVQHRIVAEIMAWLARSP
jgi:hypothetical protein